MRLVKVDDYENFYDMVGGYVLCTLFRVRAK
jgi:hypothetical protein